MSPETVSWSVDEHSSGERYDAWVDVLNQTYGSWNVPVFRGKEFSAAITIKNFGQFSVADCLCDPCGGQRGRGDISRNEQEILAIQLTLAGEEHIHFSGNDYLLGAGDIMIWDSTRPMSFDVRKDLHKISVILPLSSLQRWLPRGWHSIPRRIPAESPMGTLLKSYVLSLASSDFSDCQVDSDALSEATMALLVGTIASGQPEHRDVSLRQIQLRGVEAFIERNLDKPDLSVTAIAAANKISKRYLHWLFRSTGRTVSRYIQEERLERCRRDLMNPSMTHRTIAEIALDWGFGDPAHFCRRFKQHYGERPSDIRPRVRRNS
ncbi:helix-turn-helix domain-containing protein [Lentisalinibacter orientalis]|uniref:helix-turn-helix domain-containing protein n=1 Tax=Lentisalinibacter orientalis TaxID=2992241 RepID=UPI003869D82E